MNRYVQTLRDALKEATSELITFNEDGTMEFNAFLEKVTHDVVMNAGIVKDQYAQTGLEISDTLVEPWRKAEAEILRWNKSPDTLALMNSWTQEGGAFALFELQATTQLTAPWGEATNAILGFQSNMTNVMGSIVSAVKSNVSSLTSDLRQVKQAYDDIYTSAQRAASASSRATGGGSINTGGYTYTPTPTPTPAPTETKKEVTVQTKTSTGKVTSGVSVSGLSKFYIGSGDNITITLDGVKYGASVPSYGKVNGTILTPLRNLYGNNPSNGSLGMVNGRLYIVKDGSWYSVDGADITNAYYKKLNNTNKYAKGSLGLKKDEWNITDELGDELKLYATPQGTLGYMRAGSSIIPADLTKELIAIGEVGLDGLTNMPKFNSGINLMSNAINKPEIKFDVAEFLHVDHVDKDVLPDLEKMMDKKINELTRQMNYSLKKYR